MFFPTVCDDECTGVLLRDLDHLNQMALSVNLSGPLLPPYRMLYSFENTTQELKVYSKTIIGFHICMLKNNLSHTFYLKGAEYTLPSLHLYESA